MALRLMLSSPPVGLVPMPSAAVLVSLGLGVDKVLASRKLANGGIQ